eukprot:6207344-Pleurochrysis_carterae.AAC.3
MQLHYQLQCGIPESVIETLLPKLDFGEACMQLPPERDASELECIWGGCVIGARHEVGIALVLAWFAIGGNSVSAFFERHWCIHGLRTDVLDLPAACHP